MRRMLIVGIHLVFLAAIGIGCASRDIPSPTAGPTSTVAPTPTATPTTEPTPVRIPTDTPVATPTFTPIPTPTPIPAPTPTPPPPPTPTPVPLTEVYSNEVAGYSMSYPQGWTVETILNPDQDIALFTHPAGTHVVIEATPIPDGVTFEEVLAISLENLKSEGFKETSGTKIESPPGYLIGGEFIIEWVTVPTTAVITLNGGYSIIAGFYVIQSLQQLHTPMLDRMLASFNTFPPSRPPLPTPTPGLFEDQ